MSEPGHIAEATVRVDAGATLGPIRRIWTSFGYDEINWTSMPAGKRHLKTMLQAEESERDAIRVWAEAYQE